MICARNGHQIGWCKYSQIVSDGWTRDVKDFPGPGRRGQAAKDWRATSGCKRVWTVGAIYRLSDRDGGAVNTAWVPVFQGTLPSITPDRSCSVNRLRGFGVGIPTVSGVVWKDREALGGFSLLDCARFYSLFILIDLNALIAISWFSRLKSFPNKLKLKSDSKSSK